MEERNLYIKGAALVDPEKERIYPADILIENGRISRILTCPGECPAGVPVFNGEGAIDSL